MTLDNNILSQISNTGETKENVKIIQNTPEKSQTIENKAPQVDNKPVQENQQQQDEIKPSENVLASPGIKNIFLNLLFN